MGDGADVFIEQLYREEYKKMVMVAYTKLRSRQSAEDVVQETFTEAWKCFDRLLASPNPAGWLYLTLRNKMKHELRSQLRFSLLRDKLEWTHKTEQSDSENSPDDLFEGVSREEYELLEMIYIQGYTNIEAAEKLGISYVVCRKRVQRAKENMRKKLE